MLDKILLLVSVTKCKQHLGITHHVLKILIHLNLSHLTYGSFYKEVDLEVDFPRPWNLFHLGV